LQLHHIHHRGYGTGCIPYRIECSWCVGSQAPSLLQKHNHYLMSTFVCPQAHFHTHTVPYHAPLAALWGICLTNNQLIINEITLPVPPSHEKTHHKNGALPAPSFHTHFHTHTVPYYAPFAALWGICQTIQSIDNQLNNTTHTPKTTRKHTAQNGAIALHAIAHVLAAGEEHPQRQSSPTHSLPHSHCALPCPICSSMGHLPHQTIN
jgi:hypothetical protein